MLTTAYFCSVVERNGAFRHTAFPGDTLTPGDAAQAPLKAFGEALCSPNTEMAQLAFRNAEGSGVFADYNIDGLATKQRILPEEEMF